MANIFCVSSAYITIIFRVIQAVMLIFKYWAAFCPVSGPSAPTVISTTWFQNSEANKHPPSSHDIIC